MIRNNNKSISNGGSGQSTLKGLANMHNVVQKSENIYLDVVDLFILYFYNTTVSMDKSAPT